MLIKNNQTFQYQLSAFEACEPEAMDFLALSKICLFSSERTDKAEADGLFVNLLDSFSGSVYFKKRRYNNRLCWDVWSDEASINAWIEKTVRASDYDFLKWPQGQSEAPRLLVFDMDSTFIQVEVIDQLALCHGVGDTVAEVTEAAMRGELDFAESLESRVACLKGLSQDYINQIADDLPLSEGVEKLVNACHKHQVKVAIVSGGFKPFVEKIKQKMHLYEVKANQLKMELGLLTGELVGCIVDAQAKADFVKHLSHQLQLKATEILTIGDGANDLDMMRETGFSLAYRAKPAVQGQATGRIESTHLGYLIEVFEWL
ncbi:MAG: phosphoserine phosphatase SerB [Enterobacterales bacterium]|nr:phosphoserine phosphatase SerB [Enterobacterales bacterium]